MDFQVQEQTYFVATPTGARPVPVYVDAAKFASLVVLQEEKQRMPN